MKKLHDTTIAHIAKILQVALLTGTDIIDHLRMIDLKEGEDGFMMLEDEYSNNHNKSIDEMLEKVKDQE